MTDDPEVEPTAASDGDGAEVSDLTLGDVLAAAAEGLTGVTTADDGTALAWSRGGATFASLAGERAEFRLDVAVARAALRTPDTAPSSRGPDWVAFAPTVLDDGAIDRVEAWFLSAHRHADVRRR